MLIVAQRRQFGTARALLAFNLPRFSAALLLLNTSWSMNSTVYTIRGAHLEQDGLGNSNFSRSRSMPRYKLFSYPRAQSGRF